MSWGKSQYIFARFTIAAIIPQSADDFKWKNAAFLSYNPFSANAYDTGHNLVDPEKDRSVSKTIYWLEKVQEFDETGMDGAGNEEGGQFAEEPSYKILSRLAEIWLNGCEKENITKNPEKSGDLYNSAAEAAMNCMKGKLANKFYMLAEEAYGQME